MTTLMVTPFAPYRDGIATYATQELRFRRRNGEFVQVVSPERSAAEHYLKLGSASGWACLVRDYAHFDRIIIQVSPDLLYGRVRHPAERLAIWASLTALGRRTEVEFRIHEIEVDALSASAIERRAFNMVLRSANRITVHTAAERNDLLAAFPKAADRVEIIDHGLYFEPRVADDVMAARKLLPISQDQFAFVAIGFLQRHKGFDRAIEAFTRAQTNACLAGAHLHIVGSSRIDHPDIANYVADLRLLCRNHPSVTLHEGFVSDDDFDLWLAASDTVVLPYRQIWSSGVLERARLYGRPVIASDLPQLRDQAPVGTMLCADTAEMATAMEKLWAEKVSPDEVLVVPAEAASSGWDVSQVNRSTIEAQVRARARQRQCELDGLSVSADSARSTGSVDSLLALGPVDRPTPTSQRPGVAPAKKMIKRATDWQVEPLAQRIEALQRATVEAVAALDADLAKRGQSQIDPSEDPPTLNLIDEAIPESERA